MKGLICTSILLISLNMISSAQEITMFPGLAGAFHYYQDDVKK